MIAVGPGLLSAAAFRIGGGGGGAAPPAPPAIITIVIEGDSITSTAPSTYEGSFYSYQYDDHRPDKTVAVRAQNSRSVGASANLNDNSNTLFGNVAEDAAYAPDLLTMMIGANDFTLGTDAAYRTSLANLRAAYASARPAMKIAWSAPIAYSPTGTPHPNKANFDTQRASLLADCRNPAVWGQWADFYLPLGEHPDFADASVAAPLFGDSVHPSNAGQLLLFASFRASLDSLLDASRANSDTMYPSARPASETNLAAGQRIKRRFIVSGVRHTGHEGGISITGDGSPTIRAGGRTPSGRAYNGDVVDFELDLSSSASTARSVTITVGGDVFTRSFSTVAAVTPASYNHGGFAERSAGPSATHSFTGITFPAAGTGLIVIRTLDGGTPSGVTFDGVAATQVFALGGYHGMAAYRVPVTAGQIGSVVVTHGSACNLSAISYGTVENADAVPVSATVGAADNGAHPAYATASATVPASGIALGFLGQYGDDETAGSVTGTGNAQFVSGISALNNGEKVGVIGGRRSSTGIVGFNFSGYGNWPAGIIVFKAAGT